MVRGFSFHASEYCVTILFHQAHASMAELLDDSRANALVQQDVGSSAIPRFPSRKLQRSNAKAHDIARVQIFEFA